MGRGLSDLQKTTLRVAFENRNSDPRCHCEYCERRREDWADKAQENPEHYRGAVCLLAEDEGAGAGDIVPLEVISDHFGFRATRHLRCYKNEYGKLDSTTYTRTGYKAAFAATSRAFRRLRDRGLLVRSEHSWIAHTLTEEGVRLAEALSVNPHPD